MAVSLTICVNAQIVLSWILTSNVKTSNLFARNRVKDIDSMREQIKNKIDLTCKFTYLETNCNPADLLTRGESFKSFVDHMDTWLHGPKFFLLPQRDWPKYDLGCLSDSDKQLTINTGTLKANSEIDCSECGLLPVTKFSNLNKLLRVTALVFFFIAKLRRHRESKLECINKAKKYWIKAEQSRYLTREIHILDGKERQLPPLVKNLNLFLDSNKVVRSKGRLENCRMFEYDVRNPILLPKQSFLTELFVQEAHEQCKHLGASSTLNAVRK